MRVSVLRVLVVLLLEAGCTQPGRLGGGHPVVSSAADMQAAAVDKAGNYREALLLYNKVDTEGRDAVASLPSGGPRYVPDGRTLWPGNDLVKEQTLINVASADAAIGAHYEEGHGVARDYKKARFWYEKA